MRRRGLGAVLLAAASMAAAGCASAPASPGTGYANPSPVPEGGEFAEPPREDRTPRWEQENVVHATWIPYAWRTDPGGDQSRSGLRVPFDGDARTTGGLRAEAYLDRVSWGFDAFRARVSGDDGPVEGDLTYFTVRFAAHMRLAGPAPQARDEGGLASLVPTLDATVGVRGHFADGTMRDPAAYSDVGRSVWWGEPVAGLRGSLTVVRRLTLFGRAEGGGIDVGDWHSWSGDLEAGAELSLGDHLSLVAAWRSYRASFGDDPDDPDPYDLDIRLDGPWAGLVLEF